MGTPSGPEYIPCHYMDPIGLMQDLTQKDRVSRSTVCASHSKTMVTIELYLLLSSPLYAPNPEPMAVNPGIPLEGRGNVE